MTQGLTDKTGAPVTIDIELARPISSYTVNITGPSLVGRADFIDSPVADNERIFFHTEVVSEFNGRGLAGLLVREALADSLRMALTVVPLCPLFARHLRKHGEEFIAAGGVFRSATQADVALVAREARGRS